MSFFTWEDSFQRLLMQLSYITLRLQTSTYTCQSMLGSFILAEAGLNITEFLNRGEEVALSTS